jgi:hypothetical protein
MSNEKYFQGNYIERIGTPFLFYFSNEIEDKFYAIGGVLSETEKQYELSTQALKIDANDKQFNISFSLNKLKTDFIKKAYSKYTQELSPEVKEEISKNYSYTNPFVLKETSADDILFYLNSYYPKVYSIVKPYLQSKFFKDQIDFINLIKYTEIEFPI